MYVIMIVMALVLSFVFGNAVFGNDNAQRVLVSNSDSSDVTDAFLKVMNTGAYELEFADEKDAETSVAKSESLAAIFIPPGFGDALKSGSAALTLVKTADNADTMALENAIRSASVQTAHVYMLADSLYETLKDTGITVPPESDVAQAYLNRMGENAAVTVTVSVAGSGGYDEAFASNIHYLMGFNIFFVMFSIVFTIGSILEDKKLNTWNRIRISPLSSAAVMAGNFIPTFIVGIVQMAVVLFFGQMLFGINLGASLLPIFVVFVAFVLTSTCLGLLLSTVFNTYEQLNAGTPVILVATAMLGGCMWPLSIVGSDVLLGIANVMPQKWALEAAENLAVYGGGLKSASTSIIVLLGMAAVFFAVSILLYNKKQRA